MPKQTKTELLPGYNIRNLAFDKSFRANIISTVSDGKIIMANGAACKLLGYSKKELLTKSRSTVFDINNTNFKKMLKARALEGQSEGLVTAIKKSGRPLPCMITSAVFIDRDGIKKSITTIADMTQSILEQKNIDIKKEKIVADNIILAKSKQKSIDIKKEKVVANNIALARSSQKNIDTKKEKIVADNIVRAKSKQNAIDTINEKVVADNIALAKSKQKGIDIRNKKIVADNIVLAKSKQKDIDTRKEKIVADNIVLAKSKQKSIDIKKEQVVSDNIALAKSSQKSIDARKEKIVADNIVRAKSKQNAIDTINEKAVADNIALAKSKQKGIDIRNKKIVADNIVLAKSKQKDIDTRKEKIVADNIVLARSKQKSIDIKKEKVVANNIALARSSQKSIDTRKEKIVADNIALAKSKQKVIDTQKEKIIAGNIILAQAKSDNRQEENNEWIKYIAKTSYDVMWDWNVATGQIYVGDSIQEIFGYKVKNNTINFTDFKHCLLEEDKDTVEKKLFKILATESKSWNDAYMLKRHNGSLAATKSRASIVRNKKGEAIHLIGNTQDVTTLGVLEKKLKEKNSIRNENNDIFQLAAKLSYDGIWDWNLLTNEFFLGEGFEEIFGNTPNDKDKMNSDWTSHLHPEDKEAVEKGMGDAITSSATHWKQAYRFVKTDGSIANVFCRANIIRNSGGKALRMIGVVHDLSKQIVIEEKLEHEIKLKEMQIEEATKEAKENERSELGKELHDNVNQLLGASKLYIDMAKRGGVDSEMYLSRSSEYTLTAIEEIRKLTKGLTSATIEKLGLYESIENIARDTMEVNKVKISFAPGSFRENSVNEKFKLNVFRIVQEALNNILKHANATEVTISLTQNKKSIILSVSDNGVGFDPANKSKGIGVGNIINRAELYNGDANFISKPGEGCLLIVTFPVETL